MKIVYKKNILLFYILILLTSCDINIIYEFKVVNETPEEIKVEFKEDDIQQNVIVKPYENKTLAITYPVRCGGVYCDAYRLSYIDTIFHYPISDITIYMKDTLETKVNYNRESNWEFESRRKYGIYTARINDTVFN